VGVEMILGIGSCTERRACIGLVVGDFRNGNILFAGDVSPWAATRKNLTDSVKKNICGKVTRELVLGTLQVHHMKGYGAVELGVHAFTTRGMRTPKA
jgi:hypothetical protein